MTPRHRGAPQFTLVFPGDPDTVTGGFIYDREIRDQLAAQGGDIRTLVLKGPFPTLDQRVAQDAVARMGQVKRGTPLVIDGLSLGGFGGAVAPLARSHPLLGLVHHPLALETGLAPNEAQRYARSECDALSHCCGVIATSETTRETLIAGFGVAGEDCAVVPPGMTPFARKTAKTEASDNVRLLSVGTLTPRKGYIDLVDALAQLADLKWQLDILGDDTLDPEHAGIVRQRIADAGLERRIVGHGKRPQVELRRFYEEADVFVLAAHYEGYGMAFAEAIAAGLPVIGTTGGAIPRTVPNGCGILVEPGDVGALKKALETVITDSAQRAKMATASRIAAKQFEDWPVRAAAFAEAVNRFAARWKGTH
jgi:glycosyltransferase involved in cell wall biosynthesis